VDFSIFPGDGTNDKQQERNRQNDKVDVEIFNQQFLDLHDIQFF
jgi:hypothetical protein